MIRNLKLASLTIAALCACAVSVPAGEITGKVVLKGSPKPEIPIQLDPTCSKLNDGNKVTTRHFVVGKDGGLGNVFVYVKKGAPKSAPPSEPVILDQKSCMYQPYILGAMTGQKIVVRNSDNLLHNVHATPKVNKEFNIAQPVKGQENALVFDKPEVLVRFKCDVHPWMFAYIGVVDNPFYAVTDKEGNFKIPNVPPGNYTLEAYHLKAGTKEAEVAVADSTKPVQFELIAP